VSTCYFVVHDVRHRVNQLTVGNVERNSHPGLEETGKHTWNVCHPGLPLYSLMLRWDNTYSSSLYPFSIRQMAGTIESTEVGQLGEEALVT
jgi:hypothetical protein